MLVHQGEGSGTPTEPHHTPSPEADTSHPTTSSIPLPSIHTTPIPHVNQPDITPIRQYSRRARIAHLQRQYSELLAKFQAQEEEIVRLKERVQVLEDREGDTAKQSRDDAPIKGRSINEGGAAAERISNDSEEIARVLTSIDAATVLAGGIDVPTGSGSIPTAGPPATVISAGSEVNSPSFSGRTVPLFAAMLVHQGDGSGTPTKPHHTPSPEAQTPLHSTHPSSSLPPVTTRSLPTVTSIETTLIRQYTRRTKIAQSSVPPTIADEPASPQRDERVQQLEEREGVAVTNSRDDAPIKGRSMDEGEAATKRVSDDTKEMETVLTSMDASTVLASGVVDVPTGKELQSMIDGLDSNNETVAKYLEEYRQFSSELPIERRIELISDLVKDFRDMTFEEVEVEAKFNSVWKQMEDFIPMGSKEEVERIKRKGINLEQESAKKQESSEEITKEAKSLKEVTEEKVKEMMHLVLIEENFMHALVEWKLYDSCGVHHVAAKDKEIFMLVEKDYPLRKGLALVMIFYKLQVENFSQMENELVLKIYMIANSPRQQDIKFPLAEEVPTASVEGCHCQKKSEATARKIALLC
nr:hypothetical protein [Tanacetum cinerariifolium]